MSIVAWDGKTLASDRQATMAEMRRPVTKIWRLESGELVGITGLECGGREMAVWYENGADPAKYPPLQATPDWVRLVVVTKRRKIIEYEQRPVPIEMRERFMAWGSGRDYAMGAMAAGADALTAVKIATRFNAFCGCGFDALRLR